MSPETSDENLAELGNLLRVIADEKRLRILALLMRQERCVCDIMERLSLSQSLASHHLGVLRRTGLIRARHNAQWVYYSIDPDRLAQLNSRYLALLDTADLAPEAAYGAAPHVC